MSYLKEEKDGKKSLKRLVGFVVVGVSIILAITDQFTDYKVNITIWLTMFGSGMTMIGITVIPKIK